MTTMTTTKYLIKMMEIPVQPLPLGGFYGTEKAGSLRSMRLGNNVVTMNDDGDQGAIIGISIYNCTRIHVTVYRNIYLHHLW
jgi:hypothetical protein